MKWVALIRAVVLVEEGLTDYALNERLASKSVQGATLSLQGVDDVHGCDSLPLGMLGVGDSVSDDVFKEDLEHTAGFLVDESRDTFDTASSRQTADGRLGNTLDVITQNFAVPLGSTLS